MSAIEITFNSFFLAARDIALEADDSFVYDKQGTANCYYVRDGAASCYIAQILAKLGVSMADLIKYENTTAPFALDNLEANEEIQFVSFNDKRKISSFASELQYEQDNEATWKNAFITATGKALV